MCKIMIHTADVFSTNVAPHVRNVWILALLHGQGQGRLCYDSEASVCGMKFELILSAN